MRKPGTALEILSVADMEAPETQDTAYEEEFEGFEEQLQQFETFYDRSSLPRPYGWLEPQAPTVSSMVTSNTRPETVCSTTQCDVLCTTNTVINWVMEPIEPRLKDTMGVLPFRHRRTNRLTKITKGETPWQKYKMTGARLGRNEEMVEERDLYMENLSRERSDKDFVKFIMACRIQALYRGVMSRFKKLKGDNRRLKPMSYEPRKKPKFVVQPAKIQDELCELASLLNLAPIPGLNLVSRTKAGKRLKKIQLAGSLRLQKFFRWIVAVKRARKVMEEKRVMRVFNAARIVARFFKSLKLRTFAYRSRIEKQRRAVTKIQSMVRIWGAHKRVRYQRREVVRRRREATGALVLQRNFRKMFGSRVAQNLELVNAAVSLARDKFLEVLISEAVDTSVTEIRELHMMDDALNDLEANLSHEMINACVEEEEQRQIQMHIEKMALEAARIERERVAMELEIARRQKEEADRLRQEQEEKARMEELERKRNEERIAAENRKKAEEERIKAEEEAARIAAEAEEAAKKAAEEATSLAEFTAMTATAEGAKAQFLATQPVSDETEIAELMDFKKTMDAQAATAAGSAQVWTISTPKDPTSATGDAVRGPRGIGKSVEGEAADELSAFYLSTALDNTRPMSPSSKIAKRAVSQILEDAKTKASELAKFHAINSPHKHYSIGAVTGIVKESKKLVVMRTSPLHDVWQLLGSSKTFVQHLEHQNALKLLQECEEKVHALLEEGGGLTDSHAHFGRFILLEASQLRATCHMNMCEYSTALAAFKESINFAKDVYGQDYHPSQFTAKMGEVRTLQYQGHIEKSVKALKRLMQDHELWNNATYGSGTNLSDLAREPPTSILDADQFSELSKQLSSPYFSIHCRMTMQTELSNLRLKLGDYRGCSHHLDEAKVIMDTGIFKGNDWIMFEIELCSLQAKIDEVTSQGGDETLALWSKIMSLKRNLYEKDEEHAPDTHPALANTMLHLAHVLLSMGDLLEAKLLGDQAFKIRTEYYSDNHPALAACYYLKAATLRLEGKYVDAFVALETCHKAMTSHFNSEHYWVAKCMLLAAEITRDMGHPHEAQKLYADALRELEEVQAQYPLNKTIMDLHLGIARNLKELGLYSEALSAYDNLMMMNQELSELFGVQSHCNLESCKIDIGEIKILLGKFDEGKRLVSEAGKELAQMTAGEHVMLSDGLLVFGRARSSEGRYLDAHKIFERALHIRTDMLGPDNPAVAEVHQAIADNYRLPGSFKQAMAAETEAMRIRTSVYPEGSVFLAHSLHSRANLLRDMNKASEAISTYKDAMTIHEAVTGKESLQYYQVLGDYGDCLRVEKKLEEADSTLQQALHGIQAIVGKAHIINADHLRAYVMVCIDSNDPEKHSVALAMLDQTIMPICLEVFNETHPFTLFCRGLIGLVEMLNITPRSVRTEETTPQDLIDDALDEFDNYKQGRFSHEQPWVRYLGGYVPEHQTRVKTAQDADSVSTLGF